MMGKIIGKLKHFPACVQGAVAVAAIAFLMHAAVPVPAAEQKEQVFTNVTTAAAPSAIPLSEVALRAMEVAEYLQTTTGTTAAKTEIESLRHSLPLFSSEVGIQYRQTAMLLQRYSTLSGLQSQQQLWQLKLTRAKSWLKVMTNRASQLDVILGDLAGLENGWNKTLEAGKASGAPDALLLQIETTLSAIKSARAPLQRKRSTVLDLQLRLARDIAVCSDALQEIARAQKNVVKGTFQPDSPPVWDARQWEGARKELSAYLREFYRINIAELNLYIGSSNFVPKAILCAMVFALFLIARRRYRRWESIDNERMFASEVYEHPYCAALTIILLVLTSPWSDVPAGSRTFLQAVAIVPMIIIVRPTVQSRIYSWICALGVLFAIDAVRQAFAGVMSVGQSILVFESIIAITVTGWMMIRKSPHLTTSALLPAVRVELSHLISYALLLCFAISLVSGVAGYMNLARLLAPSVLVGGYLGLGFYAVLRVTIAVFGFFLHEWPLRRFRMVQNCRKIIEKKLYVFLIWGAILGWITRFLYYMGVLEQTSAILTKILVAKFNRGTITISLGDVLAFCLTVWISFVVSKFLRFVLQEEVYPRMHVAPGRAYAASSLIHYFILAFGFIVAIGLMGVNLTRVTVLLGAFGVGIGFGLQSVVNNFVSGLILLFERPVSVGDAIEFGDLLGEVRRIGMRSSTMRTWKGADIIVPNSQLITEKVTNWTFSDRRRRFEIPVGVNYGADPKRVMDLLEELGRRNPDILDDPRPQALFLGYGDSSINFELRAWTDKFDDWPRIRSDLVIAIYDAVSKEADVAFPFPQRDVHLVPGRIADISAAAPAMQEKGEGEEKP